MAGEVTPELKAALTKGAIVDAVLIGLGFILYATTQELAWLIGGFVLASVIWPLLLAQAGAFTRKDDGR
jgi:hypothetical protein